VEAFHRCPMPQREQQELTCNSRHVLLQGRFKPGMVRGGNFQDEAEQGFSVMLEHSMVFSLP
jgi:hypothetical protein